MTSYMIFCHTLSHHQNSRSLLKKTRTTLKNLKNDYFFPSLKNRNISHLKNHYQKKHIETKTPHAYPTIYLPSDRYHPHLAITITVRLIDHLLKLLRGLKDHLVKSPKLWMAIPPLTGILTSSTARGGGGSFKNGNL